MGVTRKHWAHVTLASYLMVESLLRSENVWSVLPAAAAGLAHAFVLFSGKSIRPWAFHLILIHKPVRQIVC